MDRGGRKVSQGKGIDFGVLVGVRANPEERQQGGSLTSPSGCGQREEEEEGPGRFCRRFPLPAGPGCCCWPCPHRDAPRCHLRAQGTGQGRAGTSLDVSSRWAQDSGSIFHGGSAVCPPVPGACREGESDPFLQNAHPGMGRKGGDGSTRSHGVGNEGQAIQNHPGLLRMRSPARAAAEAEPEVRRSGKDPANICTPAATQELLAAGPRRSQPQGRGLSSWCSS